MPLPAPGLTWPPTQLAQILPKMGSWSAWYSGDPDQLSAVYGGATGSDPSLTGFFASDHGGFRATVGRALSRWFWGEATRGPDRKVKLHVPIAAELCQASADLLFSDQISFDVDGSTATQDRIFDLASDGMHAELAESAEVAAALGGVYLRVTWDDRVADYPFITHVDADQAIPEFKWGRLSAVTFWEVIARDGKKVWRHLERHELNGVGVGVVLHGLYEGDETSLGYQVPLNLFPATSMFATSGEQSGNTGIITSETPGLCVVFVPNQTPNRIWRTDQLGRNLGRSDLDGVEQLMDALDEVYTSWMRDIRLGKARLMVAKSMLDNVGPGNGRAFDSEQEVFAPINTLINKDQPLSGQIEQVQFKIRFQEHSSTATQLVLDILRLAGYSAETFGIYDGGGGTRTATEVEAKQQRSLLSRDRKTRLWRPALKELMEKLLAVDAVLFSTPNQFDDVNVTFPDAVQESQLALAQTVQALYAAQSASAEVRVGIMHPDWDDDDVRAEVALIQKENAVQPLGNVPPDFGPPLPMEPPTPAQEPAQQ